MIDVAKSPRLRKSTLLLPDASTEITPAASDSSSGVTMEQIQKLLAERDVYWVNWLRSKERETRDIR